MWPACGLRGIATAVKRGTGRIDLPDVKKIIAVASGKGGVGKSTTAVNVAVSLAREDGCRVGLLDADIYGPSIPMMMNLSGAPTIEGNRMIPLENFRVRCMSMGFLVKDRDTVAYRGPMVMKTLEHFIRDVEWGKLDVLVLDMPPGTGDVVITIGQRLSLSGAVMVSTPQDIALLDVRRGAAAFNVLSVPLMGIVENMSYYQCKNCGHQEPVFGENGGSRMAAELGIEVLGQVPLVRSIMNTSENGAPIAVSQPDSPEAKIYHQIARRIKAKLFDQEDKCHVKERQSPTILSD